MFSLVAAEGIYQNGHLLRPGKSAKAPHGVSFIVTAERPITQFTLSLHILSILYLMCLFYSV